MTCDPDIIPLPLVGEGFVGGAMTFTGLIILISCVYGFLKQEASDNENLPCEGEKTTNGINPSLDDSVNDSD